MRGRPRGGVDEDGSFIFNKMTGEINQFREESGNYMFDVWIPPESTTTSLFSQAVTIGYSSSRIRPINMGGHAEGRKSGGIEQIRKMSTMRK